MKTMHSLSFLSLALPPALGACVDQNGFSSEDLANDGLGEESEAVRITVLDYDDNGVQTTQVVAMEADEFEALTSTRPGAPARQGAADDKEGVGTAAQALTVQSNAAGCVSRGLLIYSAANRQGEVLCLMTVGHEGGGSARFTLPLDWRFSVGTKYPVSSITRPIITSMRSPRPPRPGRASPGTTTPAMAATAIAACPTRTA